MRGYKDAWRFFLSLKGNRVCLPDWNEDAYFIPEGYFENAKMMWGNLFDGEKILEATKELDKPWEIYKETEAYRTDILMESPISYLTHPKTAVAPIEPCKCICSIQDLCMHGCKCGGK